MRRPPVINNIAVLKKKIEMMEALGDIQVATSIVNQKLEEQNQLDTQYDVCVVHGM